MILTVDIGGTNVKYALCKENGEFVEKGKYKTPKSANELVESILKLEYAYSGVAISMPGIMDAEHTCATITGKLSFLSKFPLKRFLEQKTNCKVILENDGRCATWAELGFGHLKYSKNAVVIVLGTYLGMGIVIDHKVYEGSHLLAGEYSDAHMDMERSFTNTMASYFGKEGLKRSTGLTGKKLFQNLNDKDVQQGFDMYCQNLAWMLSNIQLLLDVDTILIGGGISVEPDLIDGIQSKMEDLHTFFPTLCMPKIQACKFNNDANLLGALYIYNQSER